MVTLFSDSLGAFRTLLDLMMLPAFGMALSGSVIWIGASRSGDENRQRLGRLLFMFGIILTVIILTIILVEPFSSRY